MAKVILGVVISRSEKFKKIINQYERGYRWN